MNTITFNRPNKHPWFWMLAALSLFGLTSAIFIISKFDFSWIAKERPLEKYVWTCDSDYQNFYAPGTPQSISIVNRIHQLRKSGYLTEEIKIPDKAILITPAFFDAPASSSDPTLIIGFNLEIAETLRKSRIKEVKDAVSKRSIKSVPFEKVSEQLKALDYGSVVLCRKDDFIVRAAMYPQPISKLFSLQNLDFGDAIEKVDILYLAPRLGDSSSNYAFFIGLLIKPFDGFSRVYLFDYQEDPESFIRTIHLKVSTDSAEQGAAANP